MEGTNSRATGINCSGQVVGWSEVLDNSRFHTFLVDDGPMLELGTSGEKNNLATGINDSGQIVGRYFIAGGTHAFLYRSGTMIDLNVFAPAGWELTSATGINRFGDIVGTGVFNGQVQGFFLTPGEIPLPEPDFYAIQSAGSGLIGLVVRRRSRAR